MEKKLSYAQDNLAFVKENGRAKYRKQSSFLAITNSDLNAHTYVYDADKSLKGLTVGYQYRKVFRSLSQNLVIKPAIYFHVNFQIDALPSAENYVDLGDRMQRPTMDELKSGRRKKISVKVSHQKHFTLTENISSSLFCGM